MGKLSASAVILCSIVIVLSPLLFADDASGRSLSSNVISLNQFGIDQTDSMYTTDGQGIIWGTSVGNAYTIIPGTGRESFLLKFGDAINLGDWNIGHQLFLDKVDEEGQIAWSKTFSAGSFGQPSPGTNGTVSLAVEEYDQLNSSFVVVLYHLDECGETAWKTEVSRSQNHLFDISKWSIVDGNGTIFFRVTEVKIPELQNDDCSVYAVSSTGQVLWNKGLPLPSGLGACAAMNDEGNLIIMVPKEKMLSLDADGIVLWEHPLPDVGSDFFTIIGIGPSGNIYVCDEFHLYVFDEDGEPLWTIGLDGWRRGGFSLDENDTIYVSLYDSENGWGLYAYGSDGDLLWVKHLDTLSEIPIIVGSVIIFSSSDHIYGSDHNGSILWSYDAGDYVTDMKMCEDGTLLFLVGSSEHGHKLVASVGVPEVTLIEWISRNIIWIALILSTSVIGAYTIWFKFIRRKHDRVGQDPKEQK